MAAAADGARAACSATASFPENGAPVHNPMRLLANGERCGLVFALYRGSGVTEEDHERDAAWVAHNLAGLKALLEGRGGLRA